MAFNIDKYIKEPEWLQFVGIVGAFIALGHCPSGPLWIKLAYLHITFRGAAYIGLGMAAAGRLYSSIYP